MPLSRIRLLYVDDDEDDFLLVQSLLRKSKRNQFSIDHAYGYHEALEKLHIPYDVFLVDYRLGKETGMELLRTLKAFKKYAPVIMLTGMEDGEIDQEAMNEGAADYLVKGEFDSEALQRTIRYAIRDSLLLETLEISTHRFRNIFERAADPLILITKEGRITEANPAFISRFGLNPEATNSPISLQELLTDPLAIELVKEALEKEAELNDLETILRVRQEDPLDGLISIVLHDAQAGLFQVMIKDLTALRIRDEETRSLKRFSATGRIARILAHEVKNPLTNITLSADQLRNELPEATLQETGDLIDIIQRNAIRINQLVSELLYSTRFTELRLGVHSINTLVDQALEMANDSISLNKIAVEKHYSTDICDVEVDPEKVKIALLNLIVNAVEATEPEKGKILIHTTAKDNRCIVEITDNGPGIPAEQLDHLFEPFFTSKEKGTGLGLTNTQNIILSHKGAIRVKSEPGRGTSFIVSFGFPPAAK